MRIRERWAENGTVRCLLATETKSVDGWKGRTRTARKKYNASWGIKRAVVTNPGGYGKGGVDGYSNARTPENRVVGEVVRGCVVEEG